MFDVFHKLPVSHDLDDGKSRSRDVIIDTQVKFSTLLLEPQIHDGLVKCGYTYLSPIQQNALPLALTGSSIIAHAKSGTGKTLIYVLPVLNDFVKRKPNGLHCLVLAPTREIAKQIYDVFQNVACYVKGVQIEYFIGGTPLDMDVIKCMNCHLAIGAPGRIKHLIDLGFLKTANLEFLILDEVDALFDHKEYAVEEIISTLPSPKQLIVSTATFSSKVGDLVKSVVPSVKYTSADNLEIEEVSNISNMLIAIRQYVAPVKKDSSSMGAMRTREKLVEILKTFNFDQCFIFVNYMTLVRSICNYLISQNFSASWICSDQNQSTRINTINKLKMNHCKILVTTDLAARGIDVHKVNLVINLGLPCPPEIYIHRMGRAGRYGSEGAVITILSEGEELTTFTKMVSFISTDPIDLHVLPERIDAAMSDLNIIHCLPTEGSISVDEFSFKRQMKDSREKTAVKMQNDKKAKKKKRKSANTSKLVSQNNILDQLSSVNQNNEGMANHGEDNAVSDEMMNDCIKQFSQSLADFLVPSKLVPEWNSLKCLFGLEDDHTTSDESFAFIQNPPASLLTYARHIKQRNEFIDQQIIPCSVDEFSSLLNSSDSIFGRYSSGLCGLIKEIAGKVERPGKQQRNVDRSVTSSVASPFDSEQSEISSQVSSIDVPNLPHQLHDEIFNDGEERSISGKILKKNNACSWSKKFSGSFNLAEEFSNVMMNYDKEKYSSSSKQSANIDTHKQLPQSDFRNTAEKFEVMSAKQFFNGYKQLNSDAENNKHPNETDSEFRQSKRVCCEMEYPHQSTNALIDSVSANISSGSIFEEPKIPSKTDYNSSLSDEFSRAVNTSTSNDGPRNSSKMPWKSSTAFPTSRNHSNSIFSNGQLLHVQNEANVDEKCIFGGFNLSGQFLNAVGSSLPKTDLQNLSRRSETSPLCLRNLNRSYPFSNQSNGTPCSYEMSENQISTNSFPCKIRLSDQFSTSFDQCRFDHERQTKFNYLGDSRNKSSVNGPAHNSFCQTDANSFKPVPKFTDQEISAKRKRNSENSSKPMTEDCFLPDQFFGKTTESTSHLAPKNKLKSESSLKPIPVPENESKSNTSSVFEINNTCSPISATKSPNSTCFSENVANEESSLTSDFQQKLHFPTKFPSDLKSYRVELANNRSQYVADNYVKTFATNNSESRLTERHASDCRAMRDEAADRNVRNMQKPSVKNACQSENAKPKNNAVPISSKPVAPGSEALVTDFMNVPDKSHRSSPLCGDTTAATLPSLGSFVSSRQEQKIWQHHFKFIRHAISRGQIIANS